MDSENNKVFYTNPVEASQASLRIDKYIAGEIRDFSRAQVQRLIEEGFVFADDEVILDKNHKTRIGDVYQVNLPEPKEAAPQAENIPLDILYEDSDLIVVNKPAGMTVHPAVGVYTGTLVNALLYHCRDSLSGIGGVARPGIVHRIDRNTSGILVAAKNDIAHRGLAEQFFYHTVERTYYAVVYGIPSPEQGTITGNIGGTCTRGLNSGGCGRFAGPPARQALKVEDTARAICSGRGGGRAARPRRRQSARRPRPDIEEPRAPDLPSAAPSFSRRHS